MKSAITALALLCVFGTALAHDHSRPDLDGWFKSLRSKGGIPCCDGSDALSVEDPDWRSQDGKYQVRLNGEWRDVPDEAVVTEPNKFGRTKVWPVTYEDGAVVIRCFMPGAMG